MSLSVPEQRVFGADAKLHPITGRALEQGIGALHPDEQAIGHLGQMEYELAELTNRAPQDTKRTGLAERIAEVRAGLKEAGILDRFGEGAVHAWRKKIHNKDWSLGDDDDHA